MNSEKGHPAARHDLQVWVRNWQQTGDILEEMRLEKIRRCDTASAIMALATSFRAAINNASPSTHSGLVTLQDLLKRMRHA